MNVLCLRQKWLLIGVHWEEDSCETEKLHRMKSPTSKPWPVAVPSKAAIISLSVKLWHFV